MNITREMLVPLLPKRPRDAHKGTFGHVFILAGSRGFTGAAKLAALAAGRSGAGLVTVGIPQTLGDAVGGSLLEAMTLLLPATEIESIAYEALHTALEFATTKQAVVLGPGLSQHPATRRFVLEFIPRCPVPLLVDADGLNCLSAAPGVLDAAASDIVLTPHPGEMSRLCRVPTDTIQADRPAVAAAFAQQHRCVVVLKGHETVVASRDGTWYTNSTGNSGLATGGTGDVLSGLAGGLLAQGMAPLDAAILAVHLHGRAGDAAALKLTERAMLAGDVVDAIPAAWQELEASARA